MSAGYSTARTLVVVATEVAVDSKDVANDLLLVQLVVEGLHSRLEAGPEGYRQSRSWLDSPSMRKSFFSLAMRTSSFHSAAFTVAGFSTSTCLPASSDALTSS